MFVHISPEPDTLGETISTLKFAERVSTVELGSARVNKESAGVKELKQQVIITLYFVNLSCQSGVSFFYISFLARGKNKHILEVEVLFFPCGLYLVPLSMSHNCQKKKKKGKFSGGMFSFQCD